MSRIISDTTPTARKEHRCDMCSRTIRIGEVYVRQRVVWEYGPEVWRECQHCRALVAALTFDDLCLGEGIGPNDLQEHEPATWTEARWLVQWRRKWTRRDGTLYPVPCERGSELIQDHAFWGVAGHPDDDECTHRADGTDDTYCGAPEATHESGRWA